MQRMLLSLTLLILSAWCVRNACQRLCPTAADLCRGLGVRYSEWVEHAADRRALDRVLEAMAAVDVAHLSGPAQTAFYINLYNAAMLQVVLTDYPLPSVREIGLLPFAVFKRRFIRQGEDVLSLDQIEKEILLKEHFDARIHFCGELCECQLSTVAGRALCCGSPGGSARRTSAPLAVSRAAVRVDRAQKRIAYSSLFKWYAADFAVDSPPRT